MSGPESESFSAPLPAPLPAPDTTGSRRLVLSRTRQQRPPAVPELLLHLADDMDPLWEDLQRELDAGELPPPFWAFAWLGGQALARYVLDRPAVVAGRSVLDLATGSGLVALAALRAGAGSVTAVDVDPYCSAAVALNAGANGLDDDRLEVLVQDLLGEPPPAVDVFLAGDVFYDASMSVRVLPWLQAARAAGSRVLLGDPVRHYLPQEGLTLLAEHDVPTTRELEGVDVKRVRVLELTGTGEPMSDDSDTQKDFRQAVNMTAKQLEDWLQTGESKSVGQKDGGGESTGHESGRLIVEILRKKQGDLTDDDRSQMARVVSYVHRHLAQRPTKEEIETSRWRYSLMNWGHDPLKD